MDREQLDREQKALWSRAADRWGRRQAEMREQTAPVSRWMVEAIDPSPGQRVLELAAGPGETGFLAAARIQPGGVLISSDQADEMVDVARARAAELGLDNVEFRAMDAQLMDVASDAVDAVLCRFGYMLMADRGAALRETHRVLRPGGRLALAVWDTPDRNMWMAAPVIQLVTRGAFTPPQPGEPSPFAMANQDELAAELGQAGFGDVIVQRVEFTNNYRDFDYYWDLTLDLAAPIRDALENLSDDTTAEVREAVHASLAPFAAPDDHRLSVPASAVVASARA